MYLTCRQAAGSGFANFTDCSHIPHCFTCKWILIWSHFHIILNYYRRSNTLTHASLRACGAQLDGSVWKKGKQQNPFNLQTFQPFHLLTFQPFPKVSRKRKTTKSLEKIIIFKGFCCFSCFQTLSVFKVRKFELSAAGAKRVVCKCIRVTIPEA